MPELTITGKPKDRRYFFNILNTLKPDIVEKIVFNAYMNRKQEQTIKNEIIVKPEFKDLFDSQYSLIGNKGGTIKMLRKDHKQRPISKKKRK